MKIAAFPMGPVFCIHTKKARNISPYIHVMRGKKSGGTGNEPIGGEMCA